MSTALPSELGLALKLLRQSRGWQQQDLARAMGWTGTSYLAAVEAGRKTPSAATLDRIAAALGFAPTALPVALAGIRDLRNETLVPPAVQLGAAKHLQKDREAALNLQELVRRHLYPSPANTAAQLLTSPAALARAERLMAKLLCRSDDERRILIEESAAFQCEALVVVLCAKSIEKALTEPREGVKLAQLAVDVAETVPGDQLQRESVQGYAWAFLANALRVSSDLPGAVQSFDRANGLLAGREDGNTLLQKNQLLDLQSSLRIDQGLTQEALRLLDQALTAGADPAVTLLKKARALAPFGQIDPDDCIRVMDILEEARPLIDGNAQPRLLFIHHQLLAHVLCTMERYPEAEVVAREAFDMIEPLGYELDLLRLRWLGGRIAAGLGCTEEAIATLSEVRNQFLARDDAYDAALASLELATVLAPTGRNTEAQALARECAAILCAQNASRGARAAFELLRQTT